MQLIDSFWYISSHNEYVIIIITIIIIIIIIITRILLDCHTVRRPFVETICPNVLHLRLFTHTAGGADALKTFYATSAIVRYVHSVP